MMISRRDFVQAGALTTLGLTLRTCLRSPATARAQDATRPSKSCILIWLDGGPSHLDSFDPKPLAPSEVRGPFETISTKIPGVAVSEMLPGIATRMDRVSLIRSMTSPLGEHNFGAQYLLTGYRPTPALDYPTLGSVVAHFRKSDAALPPYIAIPNMRVGGGKFAPEGFLGPTASPFEVGDDPGRDGFRIQSLDAFDGLTDPRLAERRRYLARLNAFDAQLQHDPGASSDAAFEQAYRLLTSEGAKKAFQLESESTKTRQRYGMKSIGQSCLLARRLIENGVPFVTVNNTGWDTHEQLYTRLKEGYTGAKVPVGLIPSLDTAVSALIDDLVQRDLFDQTLVCVMGEFGRTPKLNPAGGRDHWPRVFSVLLAGGGVPGGLVLGSSDATGESPADRPITPSDLAATIYRLVGIDPTTTLTTPDGRPVTLTQKGQPVSELFR